MSNGKRIQTLEGLRALAFIAVMISHAGFERYTEWTGAWGVSVFFVLLGFVSMLGNKEYPFIPSIKTNIKYMCSRITKTYPVHIITMLAMVIFNFLGTSKVSVIRTIRQLVTNILLIQEWFPIVERSINKTSWFLCAVIMFYFISPWILPTIKKVTPKRAVQSIILLFLMQLIAGLIGYSLPKPVYSEGMILDSDIVCWFIYRFPPVRLIDILIGCNLGVIFQEYKNKIINNASLYELLAVFGIALTGMIYEFVKIYMPHDTVNTFLNYHQWFTYSLIFTPVSVMLVYLFALGQGVISRKTVNKATMFLAHTSSYGFLIHTVVFWYLTMIGRRLLKIPGEFQPFLNITIGVAITLVLSNTWITAVKGKK